METKRILLRNFKLEDLNDMFEYCSQENVGINAGWLPHKDIYETQNILNLFINNKNEFAIVYKEHNKVIGSFAIKPLDESELDNDLTSLKGCEIGYVLNNNYWNKGIMTEVVNFFKKYILDELNYDFIIVSHYIDNLASEMVIKKSNFTFLKNIERKTRFGVTKPSKLYVYKK